MVDNIVQLQTAVIEKVFVYGYPENLKHFLRMIYDQFGYRSPVPRKATGAVHKVLPVLRGQTDPPLWIREKPRLLEMVESIVQNYKASQPRPYFSAWPFFTPPPPSTPATLLPNKPEPSLPTQDLRSADAFSKLENPEPQPVLQPAEQLLRPMVDVTEYVREMQEVMMTKFQKEKQMFRRAIEDKDRRVQQLQTTVSELQKMQRERHEVMTTNVHKENQIFRRAFEDKDRQVKQLQTTVSELQKKQRELHEVVMTNVQKEKQIFLTAVEDKDRQVKQLQTTVSSLQKMQRELTLQSERTLSQMVFQMRQKDRQIEDLARQNIELRMASSSK